MKFYVGPIRVLGVAGLYMKNLNFQIQARMRLVGGLVANLAAAKRLRTRGLASNIRILLLLRRLPKRVIDSTQGKLVAKKFRPGDVVPNSGVYRVTHASHRLMHEATLLEDQRFPLCRQCKLNVRFELLRAVKNPTRISSGYHAILEDYPDPEPFLIQ